MSRIGKRPVAIPSGVSADIADGVLTVKGPKGTLTLSLREEIAYKIDGDSISVLPANDTKAARAFWGMQRTLVDNLVTGVTQGYTKVLEITGVGYRANSQGKNLKLQLGYSHDVDYAIPEGIEIKTPDNTTVEIIGIVNSSDPPVRSDDVNSHVVRVAAHPVGQDDHAEFIEQAGQDRLSRAGDRPEGAVRVMPFAIVRELVDRVETGIKTDRIERDPV